MTANIGADFEGNSGGVVLFGQTLSAKTLGIVLGVVLTAGAVYLFVNSVQPLWTTIESTKTGIEGKRASNTQKTAQIKQKGDLPQKAASAKERSEVVLSLLPDVDTMDTLLIDLNKLISSTNVSPLQLTDSLLDSFAPSAPSPIVPEGQYRTQTLNIQFASSYSDIVAILRSIESLRTLVVVQNLQLTKKPSLTLRNPGNLTPDQQRAAIDKLPPVLNTTFTLVANIPASEAEVKAISAATTAAAEAANPAKK